MRHKWITRIVMMALYAMVSSSFFALRAYPLLILPAIPLVLAINFLPGWGVKGVDRLRLKICLHGDECLTVFLGSAAISILYHLYLAMYMLPDSWLEWGLSALVAFCLEMMLFWNGIICVYLTSVQLGIRLRVVGLLCGLIPVAQLVALGKIMAVTFREVREEAAKDALNEAREDQRLCATKYPILLVHGVCFRDFKHLSYWGRIPRELERNGATVYFGEHQSARPVQASAEELSQRIRQLTGEGKAEKVNIIAHSKGGLDCRWAMRDPDIAARVASLTTVNTPHQGCEYADYLLNKISVKTQKQVAEAYNNAARLAGDTSPDFLAAMRDLTASACQERNRQMPQPEGVYCQSVGSVLKRAVHGKFPLQYTYHVVKEFDGPNDGLVGTQSFPWGDAYELLEPTGRRGISHGDVIDLNRENIPGFDVREYYVQLVSRLREKGY
ncbi:MAG: triacylglycerol lipase [Ruminococcaceae bacterium]|nr:triacylglycerol lipase [Oscillospiraceae bacterium]